MLKQVMSGKVIVCFMLIVTLVMGTICAYADTFENYQVFANANLPHYNDNTTLASKTKTTSRSYGKVEITRISGGSDGINVWFRTKYNGECHYDLGHLKSFTEPCTKKVVYNTDNSNYYSAGRTANLRAENITTTQVVYDQVTGKAYFN